MLVLSGTRGLVQLAGPTSLSAHEMAREVCRWAGGSFTGQVVERYDITDNTTRPTDVSLDSTRIRGLIGDDVIRPFGRWAIRPQASYEVRAVDPVASRDSNLLAPVSAASIEAADVVDLACSRDLSDSRDRDEPAPMTDRVGMARIRVVVPLHQGEEVIAGLVDDLASQEGVLVHLAVVANGCQDGSAAAARRTVAAHADIWASAVVVELPGGGRRAALAAGESALPDVGPLVVCDQDVRLPTTTLREVVKSLAPGSPWELVTPSLLLPPGLDGLATRYWRVWTGVPYVEQAPVSVGLYAVSARGRARWGDWPALDADDKFVRGVIGSQRCHRLRSTHYSVSLPAGVRQLVSTRARYLRSQR